MLSRRQVRGDPDNAFNFDVGHTAPATARVNFVYAQLKIFYFQTTIGCVERCWSEGD